VFYFKWYANINILKYISFNVIFITIAACKNLTIYAVPHSHNDAGWLKSFDEYYITWTKDILDHIIDILRYDKTKIFNWADIGKLSSLITKHSLTGGGWNKQKIYVISPEC
jgi:hypothetical protein